MKHTLKTLLTTTILTLPMAFGSAHLYAPADQLAPSHTSADAGTSSKKMDAEALKAVTAAEAAVAAFNEMTAARVEMES